MSDNELDIEDIEEMSPVVATEAVKLSTWFEPVRILLFSLLGLVWFMATFVSNTNASILKINGDFESAILKMSSSFESSQELSKAMQKIEIQQLKADIKRNELRNVRLENSIIESTGKLDSIESSLNKIVNSFPYIYAKKDDVVMKSQINKQYLNK